jgi:hypothetical protein
MHDESATRNGGMRMQLTGEWKRLAVLGAFVVVAAVAVLVAQKAADTRRQAQESEEETWSV